MTRIDFIQADSGQFGLGITQTFIQHVIVLTISLNSMFLGKFDEAQHTVPVIVDVVNFGIVFSSPNLVVCRVACFLH